MNVLHERELIDWTLNEKTTALYTQRQGFQEPWLLALSLGVKLCDGCVIPASLLIVESQAKTLPISEIKKFRLIVFKRLLMMFLNPFDMLNSVFMFDWA